MEKFIQPAVLSLISKEPLHGYLIVQRLRQMPMFEAHAPDAAGVYRLLKVMQKRGLIVGAWDLSQSGAAKKQLRITGLGRECLRRWVVTLRAYHGQLGAMLKDIARFPRRSSSRAACCSQR